MYIYVYAHHTENSQARILDMAPVCPTFLSLTVFIYNMNILFKYAQIMIYIYINVYIYAQFEECQPVKRTCWLRDTCPACRAMF